VSAEPSRAIRGAGGIDLRWYAWRPEAPPRSRVLIVHGLGDHANRYAELARTLTARGHSVIAYDQRGHGRSPGARGHADSVELLVRDLAAARSHIDQVLDRSAPVILLGHSMGGLLALEFLSRPGHEVAAAVLSAPWLATRVPVPSWKRAAGRVLARLWPSVGLPTGHGATSLTHDPTMISAYNEDPLVHTRVSPSFFLDVERAQQRLLERRDGYGIGLLFLVPDADPIVRSEVTMGWASSLPNGDVTVRRLRGMRHEPFSELERHQVFGMVAEWIDRRL
jgi:alpha-beta hydrolase superfamily lysophospholipase